MKDSGYGAMHAVRAGATYDGTSESIAAARYFATRFVAQLHDHHGVATEREAIGSLQLVVSELVTNACKFAPGPTSLDLEFAGGKLEITVSDTSTTMPVVMAADPGRVGQHGLEIVRAVCDGFEVHREPAGKRIRVLLPLRTAIT
ncbi:ATP-binding protein [Streptomyces sp. NBC_00306]|uniref:ATP-binding protein n=1 Tax=Streptomyces sp. NBC_00306 TaxID=2975708 RepID=UPI002E288348|nr:ATP-binding protein [Streptomyces sp. NBC_00306]